MLPSTSVLQKSNVTALSLIVLTTPGRALPPRASDCTHHPEVVACQHRRERLGFATAQGAQRWRLAHRTVAADVVYVAYLRRKVTFLSNRSSSSTVQPMSSQARCSPAFDAPAAPPLLVLERRRRQWFAKQFFDPLEAECHLLLPARQPIQKHAQRVVLGHATQR